jgi:hypothetical protein
MSAGVSRFRSKWHAWRALPWRERLLLPRLVLWLALVDLGLRLAGYARLRAGCDRLGGRGPFRAATLDDLAAAHRLAELAAIAGRRGPRAATCLRQALVVGTLLRRQGLDAQLRIGVQPDAERFGAHAWVELGGVALGPQGAAFAPLHRVA